MSYHEDTAAEIRNVMATQCKTQRINRELCGFWLVVSSEELERWALTIDALAERAKRLEEALRIIEAWSLPATGSFWKDGTPMSYGGAFGSNGEREYMRQIARVAIASLPKEKPCLEMDGVGTGRSTQIFRSRTASRGAARW